MNGYFEIIKSSVIVYLFIIIAIRLFGKKEIAQLSVIDLVFILLISNSVQNAMVGQNSTLEGGLVAAGSLFIVNMILKFFTYRSKFLSKLIEGEPVILIRDGIVNEENMNKEKISRAELDEAVREHGIKDIKKINIAMLEVDGNISIISDDFKRQTIKKHKAHKIFKRNS